MGGAHTNQEITTSHGYTPFLSLIKALSTNSKSSHANKFFFSKANANKKKKRPKLARGESG